MERKTVMITGGAGFIGSHTVVELAEAGYGVVIVDNLSNAELSIVDGIREITGRFIPFEQVDCCDSDALDEVFIRYRPDAIIHFAALKSVAESTEKPLDYYRNNLLSLINVLECMRRHGAGAIVFSSSATVYGDAERQPVTELTPRKEAVTPYGNTKQMSEDILRDSIAAYPELRGIALRYFNPIGAHPSGHIGELPQGVPNNLMPYITQTAAGVREKITIFGNDYPTPDGTAVRDYIDVNDLAAAHVSAVDRLFSPDTGEKYEVINIGTGRGVSVLELIETFNRANGLSVPYVYGPRRRGDVASIWADVSLARKLLGWSARKPLEETLRDAWRWEKRYREIE